MLNLNKKSAKTVTKTGALVTLIVFLAACSHEQISQNDVEPIPTESASIRETPEPLAPPPPPAPMIEKKTPKSAHKHLHHRVMVAKHHSRRGRHTARLQASHKVNITAKSKTPVAIGEVGIQPPPTPPAPPAPVLTIVDPPAETQGQTSWLFWLSGAVLLAVGGVALKIRRTRTTQGLVYNS